MIAGSRATPHVLPVEARGALKLAGQMLERAQEATTKERYYR
jgi:hypothetical protein